DPVACRLGHGRARHVGADRAATRPCGPGRRGATVRDPHPRPLQSGGQYVVQHRAGFGRHHSHHDHADLHRALGDARDRTRDHGEPFGPPVEIMLGKIIPYIIVGFVQAALIIAIGIGLFGVPLLGSLLLLALLSTLFITTNLSIGYTFSTIAQNQLQAMQMSMMFFLPNILLSGFMFPFAGMPAWAQWIGEFLPLTHYLRIVRGIMLKGAAIADLRYDTLALAALMLIAMTIAVTRFRRTLD